MELPLISHPAQSRDERERPADETTDEGHLRLTAHNGAVAERATRLFDGPADHERVLHVAASMHDFGKATPQFQEHIRPDETYNGPDEEKFHARLGALVTWFVLDRLDVPDRDRLAATLAVARHHQALPDAAPYTADTLTDAFRGEVIRTQLDCIDEAWPDAADRFFEMVVRDREEPSAPVSWEAFYEWACEGAFVEDIHAVSARQELSGPHPWPESLPDRVYDRTLHYWASITLADKSHAAVASEGEVFDLATLDIGTLDEYIRTLREKSTGDTHEATLNDERERARRQAIRGVHEWLDTDRSPIATLTLPTGLGKTFTGLSGGFEARDVLDATEERGHPRPLVYALPYTSIIEQTREIFEDQELWGADPAKSALTVHHYLSETVVVHDEYDESDTDAADDDMAGLLGESWRDGTILTTFVQLFESLTGPSNRQGLKLPALDSGLIVLDEPQALPKDWWDAIPRLLETLTEEFGARVIAMTATQPSLLRNMETVSLLEAGLEHDGSDCERCRRRKGAYDGTDLPPVPTTEYFENAERVRYTLDSTALSHQSEVETSAVGYENAAERIIDRVGTQGSVLAVCNTIGSSTELTEKLLKRSDTNAAEVKHLGATVGEYLDENNVDAVDSSTTSKEITEVARRILGDTVLEAPTEDGESWSAPADAPIYAITFNSRYRPFDRRILVTLIDQLSTASVRFVCVSTQAIEAGVDVSFETVFRDIAPIDSIVQAAGRCNRSYEWGVNGGEVVVWTLADPGAGPDDNTKTGSFPAAYVYERGSTDAGIPAHLRIVSDVLAGIGRTDDVPDAAVSKHAVDAYFERLDEKSVASTEIRSQIDKANARWLSRRSLIGGYHTLDVLVAVSRADEATIDAITAAFTETWNDREGYERLDEASQLRVSLPARVIEEASTLVRIDHRGPNEDGAQVFRYTGGRGLEYELDSGGLQETGNSVADRFSVL
jgi:CRISPR-associated endonuclease Cas3-HD